MEVKVVSYYELPEDVRDEMPNNGVGAEEANYLEIVSYTGDVFYYSDAMEPEDARFDRDLSWIKDVLVDVYELGVAIGRLDHGE